jgi:hypothetical protein
MVWQKISGHTRRAKVEAGIGRWKPVIRDSLRSRIDARRATEVEVAVHVLNRMLVLARPNYDRIVWHQTKMGVGVSVTLLHAPRWRARVSARAASPTGRHKRAKTVILFDDLHADQGRVSLVIQGVGGGDEIRTHGWG